MNHVPQVTTIHCSQSLDGFAVLIDSAGPKHRQRFLSELRISTLPYVGAGNSTNRKDAEKNAARDYISFLVRSGKIRPNEVPGDATDGVIAATAGPADIPSLMSQNTAAPVFTVSSQ